MSTRPLRVVYLVSTLRRAGPTAQLLNILGHLEPGRIAPVVVTLSPEPADTMLERFQAIGTPVRSLALSRLQAFVHRGWRREIGLRAGAPLDENCVVHSQGVRADVIASRWLGGLTRVATARNYPYDDYPLKFGLLPGWWLARSHLRAFRHLPNVIACSATLAGQLRARGIAAEVIRNGVDTSRFRPASQDERVRLRASFGLPPDARVVVSVGALSPRKDPLAVIRALRMIDDASLVLVFLGEGPQASACRREAGTDARIRFTGEVVDVAGYLRAADILVSASHSEGLPNAVLEAMACGLRLVLSDIGPHRELLAMAPGVGEAFPVGDERALSACLACVGRGARATSPAAHGLSDLLGAERMARSYESLYLRLAAAGGRA